MPFKVVLCRPNRRPSRSAVRLLKIFFPVSSGLVLKNIKRFKVMGIISFDGAQVTDGSGFFPKALSRFAKGSEVTSASERVLFFESFHSGNSHSPP